MEIRYGDIVLRDYKESDIEDSIRWNTRELEWAEWDAPWEAEESDCFDAEEYCRKQVELLANPIADGLRSSFEIDTAEGVHIGRVNSYLVDENFNWIPHSSDVSCGQTVYRAIGIDIMNSENWGRGFGTQALTAFIEYLGSRGFHKLLIQIWSCNGRMIRCAEKLGFGLCARERGVRRVRGETYDALTFSKIL